MLVSSSISSLIRFFLYSTVLFSNTDLVSKMSLSGDAGGDNNNNNPNQACAACRHQRRKCQNCPLSPYFPPNHTQQFLNVHRLFGVSNVMKILKTVDPDMWPHAMETIQFEADVRRKDPINGCLGIIEELRAQLEAYNRELEIIRRQLIHCKQSQNAKQQQQQLQQQICANILASSSTPPPPLVGYQYQSQELIELVSLHVHSAHFIILI